MELQVAEKDKKVNINIHEPYLSEFGLKGQVNLITLLSKENSCSNIIV